jgi:hypothetical protein
MCACIGQPRLENVCHPLSNITRMPGSSEEASRELGLLIIFVELV